jgi:hydroxyproline O-arabinosyltransferase
MAETDYVMVGPVHAPLAEDPTAPSVAFPFGYIVPTYPTIEGVMRKYFPPERGSLELVPGSGPAPALMRVDEWLKVTPEWERITAEIEEDEEAKEQFGWVREMYAWSIAAALVGVKVDLQLPPQNSLMVQPPADKGLGLAVFMHYTWATFIMDKETGKEVWRFEKRDFTGPEHVGTLKKLTEPPPFQAGKWELLDKQPVSAEMYDVVKLMVVTMNKGIETLKALPAR